MIGVVGTIFYFLHVILGEIYYPGYNPLAQAVSDLTAATAPSREIASAYSTVYALFTVAACTLLCVFYQGRVNKVFRLVPVGFFGVAERLSVYSVVVYSAALSLFTFRYRTV